MAIREAFPTCLRRQARTSRTKPRGFGERFFRPLASWLRGHSQTGARFSADTPRPIPGQRLARVDVTGEQAVEGEALDAHQVRSSVARRLGLDMGGLEPADRRADGVVQMTLDATQHFSAGSID